MITAPLPWSTQGDSFLTKRLGDLALGYPEVSGVLFAKGDRREDLEVTMEVRGHALTVQARQFTFSPFLLRPRQWVAWSVVDLREGTSLVPVRGVLDLPSGVAATWSVPNILALVPED